MSVPGCAAAAAYRLLHNPRLRPEDILQPHREVAHGLGPPGSRGTGLGVQAGLAELCSWAHPEGAAARAAADGERRCWL